VSRFNGMEDHLAYLIASVNRRLEEELEEKLRPDGIPIQQFRILGALTSQNGQSMGDLATQVLVESTTLTKIIDRMVADGLVYRAPDPKDRRKVLICLATKGIALHERLGGLVGDQQRQIIKRLENGKAEELQKLLLDLVRVQA